MGLVGFDTNINCQSKAATIKANGYDFVARYYNVNSPSKNLTYTEAQALSNANVSIVAIWENGYPTSASYFSYAKGKTDGANAYNYASRTIGQPEGTPIFFAVDYDASSSDISGVITNYFNGVLDAAIAAGGQYPIGVYGSGNICQYLLNNSKVEWTWLAQSTGWGGYKTFTSWNIKQGAETTIVGLNSDSDVCSDNSDPTFF